MWDDVNALYAEVMKIEGFDEITLGDAFDHLVQNKMMAKTFMAKNLGSEFCEPTLLQVCLLR